MLAPLALLVHLSVAASPDKGVYSLPPAEFRAQAMSDLEAMKVYAAGLSRLQEQLAQQPALFRSAAKTPYSPEEKRRLLSAWGAFFSYTWSAEAIRQRYWNFVKVLPFDGQEHSLGYLLTHLALTTELAHGLSFADRTAGNAQLEVLLDEPNPEFGVPPRAFAQFKEKVIHVSTSTQLFTGDAYLPQVLPTLKKLGLAENPNVRWSLDELKRSSQAARGRLLKRGPALYVKNATDVLKDGTLSAIFPLQKGIAEWMGDTRVRRLGKMLIQKEQVQKLLARLQPGDIVLARQNWFLSNIGLPGFWPHAELFVSTAAELDRFFADDEPVRAYLASLPGKPATLSAHLSARFPEKWRAYGGLDFQGHGPVRVIESISEGVSFTAVEHAMVVDYLAVMRPRLPKVEKARAIVRAFEYQGRPYDFDFDFFSDSTLVCTELVYKSYAPGEQMKGLKVPLVDVAGRMTLPANELVRLFDAEYERPDRQLDFVAFLDGREGEGRAVEADAKALRQSHARVKWDVSQK